MYIKKLCEMCCVIVKLEEIWNIHYYDNQRHQVVILQC